MLRVLFIALAVVSIALAVILGQPFLYFVAAGLLVAVAVMLTERFRRQKPPVRATPAPSKITSSPQDDLSSFGIMEIRPKGSNPAPGARAGETRVAPLAERAPPPAQASAGSIAETEPLVKPVAAKSREKATPEPRSAAPEKALPRGVRAQSSSNDEGTLFGARSTTTSEERTAGGVRKRPRTPRIMVEGVAEAFPAEVMLPTLHALRSALDANTVVLLRQQGTALRYYVDAIVSRNAFARNGGRFIAAEPLLVGQRPLDPAVFDCVGPEAFDAHRLGYYHDAIAVHQVAFLPLTTGESGSDPFLLVADSMDDGKFKGEYPRRMLRDFGRLIQSMVSAPERAAATRPPVGKTPGNITARDSSGEDLKPRREIIAEEMRKAQESGNPLALALVYLNEAETVGEAGEGAVAQAEKALEAELSARAADGRVERFGELTYGVFRTVDTESAASWASELHLDLAGESAALSGGVSVGVAMLGDQHDGPDELRADATSALRESLESGECIVLE